MNIFTVGKYCCILHGRVFVMIMIQFLKKYMINGMILILILLIFRSLMAMPIDVPLMVYIYLNLFALPEHLHVLLTSIIVTNF